MAAAIIDNQAAQTPDVSVQAGGDQRLAKAYMSYYLTEHLRAPQEKARAFCPKG